MKPNVMLGLLLLFVLGTHSKPARQDHLSCAVENLTNPLECPAHDSKLPIYVPSPHDCTEFFQCTNGIARCLKCSPGTSWDSELQVCNFESVVHCTVATTHSPNPDPIDGENQVSCPPGYYGFFRHEYNCSLYYQCAPGGIAHLMACSTGLYWNPEANYCDWPRNVPDCQGGTLPPPTILTD